MAPFLRRKRPGIWDLALSDDEGLVPNQPAFIGLFSPQVFRSLLFKALSVTRLGGTPPPGEVPSTSTIPASSLFAEPEVEPEMVPAPKLFTDVILRQWALPRSGPTPNGLCQSAPALSSLLQVPPVDAPIAALTSAARSRVPLKNICVLRTNVLKRPLSRAIRRWPGLYAQVRQGGKFQPKHSFQGGRGRSFCRSK